MRCATCKQDNATGMLSVTTTYHEAICCPCLDSWTLCYQRQAPKEMERPAALLSAYRRWQRLRQLSIICVRPTPAAAV
jgi:hypothetical protein